MRIVTRYGLILFGGLLVQFAWLRYCAPFGIAPNVILVFLLAIGLTRGPMEGQMTGFIWGLAWDVLSADLFGSHAFMFTLIGYLSGLLSRKWNESKAVTQVILTGVASVVFWFGMYALDQVFSPRYTFTANYIVFLQPVYNMLIAPLVFFAVVRWIGHPDEILEEI